MCSSSPARATTTFPLPQLWEQIRLLSAARSITARVFTAQEQAQAHCQIGNLPLAISAISD
jgi:hypothetical protein